MQKKNNTKPETLARSFAKDIGLVLRIDDFKNILLNEWEKFLTSDDKEDRKFALKELSQYVFPKNIKVTGVQEIKISIEEMNDTNMGFENMPTTEANVIEESNREQ